MAIDFFHLKKIIHRDIKLENILINKQTEGNGSQLDIRVADFGLGVFTPNDELLTLKCGTPGYCAPEILRGHSYSYKADIFSLGSLFFNLLTGRFLFNGKDLKDLLKANILCNMTHIDKYIKNFTDDAKNLLLRMLEPNP